MRDGSGLTWKAFVDVDGCVRLFGSVSSGVMVTTDQRELQRSVAVRCRMHHPLTDQTSSLQRNQELHRLRARLCWHRQLPTTSSTQWGHVTAQLHLIMGKPQLQPPISQIGTVGSSWSNVFLKYIYFPLWEYLINHKYYFADCVLIAASVTFVYCAHITASMWLT